MSNTKVICTIFGDDMLRCDYKLLLAENERLKAEEDVWEKGKMTENEKIEALQNNKGPFGLMEEELQKKARKIGKGKFQIYLDTGWEMTVGDHFYGDTTYRLSPDYHEPEAKEEFELREIKLDPNGNGVFKRFGYDEDYVDVAPRKKGFVGYLFEDGKIRADNIAYQNKKNGSIWPSVTLKELDDREVEIIYATHVVYRN